MDKLSQRGKIDKSYDLINSKYSVSANQSKIVLTVLSLIRPDDTEFKNYSIPVSEFKWLVENDNYTRLRTECRKLMSQVLEIPQENGGWLLVNWFSKIRYIPKKGVIEVRIEEDLKPYLLKMKDNFSSVYLTQVMKLTSEYAIRIYEMATQYKKIGSRTIELEDLHELFQTPKSYRTLYSNFKRKVLDISTKEINKLTDLTIECNEIKSGRKVTAIQFEIKTKKKIAEQQQEQEQFSMFEEVEIVEKHETIEDWLIVPAHKNIMVEKKTYHIKKVKMKNNKFCIETDRGDLKQTHKSKKKMLTHLKQWHYAYAY